MIAEAVRYYTRENYYENRWKIRITKTQTVGYLRVCGTNNCNHTCSHRIQEEEKLAHGCADIEGIEGLLEAVELGEGRYQLQNVVLQVLGRQRE